MASYTHYWTNDTCDRAKANGDAGKLLDHVGDRRFVQRGVTRGDNVYVVTVRQGRLFLVGRLTVGTIVHSDSEAQSILGYEPWPAPDHLIAHKGQCTTQEFDRGVPHELVTQLRFDGPEGPQPLNFKNPAELDKQTLREVRRLTPMSAKLLDSILNQQQSFDA